IQMTNMWTYRDDTFATMTDPSSRADSDARSTDLTGFSVEARDGSIGKIDEASYEAGASSIVVDTGPWIFGKKRLLPAGVVDTIDLNNRTVRISCTKDQVKSAPDFDEMQDRNDDYRSEVGRYYTK
ncbi:MAG: hypothetical protein ABIM89_00080, partial [Mycobacteriales bacterium]